jgi:hypothetical protein
LYEPSPEDLIMKDEEKKPEPASGEGEEGENQEGAGLFSIIIFNYT